MPLRAPGNKRFALVIKLDGRPAKGEVVKQSVHNRGKCSLRYWYCREVGHIRAACNLRRIGKAGKGSRIDRPATAYVGVVQVVDNDKLSDGAVLKEGVSQALGNFNSSSKVKGRMNGSVGRWGTSKLTAI